MKVSFNLEKRYVYFVLAGLLLFAGIIFVNAYIGSSGVGHDANDIGPGTMQGPISVNGVLSAGDSAGYAQLGKLFSGNGYGIFSSTKLILGSFGNVFIGNPDGNVNLWDRADLTIAHGSIHIPEGALIIGTGSNSQVVADQVNTRKQVTLVGSDLTPTKTAVLNFDSQGNTQFAANNIIVNDGITLGGVKKTSWPTGGGGGSPEETVVNSVNMDMKLWCDDVVVSGGGKADANPSGGGLPTCPTGWVVAGTTKATDNDFFCWNGNVLRKSNGAVAGSADKQAVLCYKLSVTTTTVGGAVEN